MEFRVTGLFATGYSRGLLTSIVELILRPNCFVGDFAERGGFWAVFGDVLVADCSAYDLIDENIFMSFCEPVIENLPLLDATVLTDSVPTDSVILKNSRR